MLARLLLTILRCAALCRAPNTEQLEAAARLVDAFWLGEGESCALPALPAPQAPSSSCWSVIFDACLTSSATPPLTTRSPSHHWPLRAAAA